MFEKKYLPPIKQVGDGSYCHIGIQCNIIRHLIEDCITVPLTDHFRLKLALSFDGLPIEKSSASQFWPIQGRCLESRGDVFLIGLYFRRSKPSSVDEYLFDLIEELKVLKEVLRIV
jgi:hypothetical protein